MAAASNNFRIEAGADWNVQITWKDSDDDPIDLTGYSALMHVREYASADSTILELDDGDEITLGGTAGTITIEVPASTTKDLDDATLVYDLFVTSPSNVKTKLLKGEISVDEAVTRE